MKSVNLLAATALALCVFAGGRYCPEPPHLWGTRRDRRHLAARYGETAVSLGLGPGNRVVEVFASEETGTWTITVTSVNGTTCLVASGDSYTVVAPVPQGEPLWVRAQVRPIQISLIPVAIKSI